MLVPTRKTLRKKGFNYTGSHCYFITIVVHNRLKLFTERTVNGVQLNAAGKMIEEEWLRLKERFNGNVHLHAHVVMADHFHALLEVLQSDAVEDVSELSNDLNQKVHLGEVIGAFKSITTVSYIRGMRAHKWTQYGNRLWQRNYYEVIIRDTQHFNATKGYIAKNEKQRI